MGRSRAIFESNQPGGFGLRNRDKRSVPATGIAHAENGVIFSDGIESDYLPFKQRIDCGNQGKLASR